MDNMIAANDPKIIVVVGATGQQGGGAVRALLSSTTHPWLVRGLTRDPESTKSRSFLSKNQTTDSRLSLTPGHVYDKDSLVFAFTGAYGVFAITNEAHPTKTMEKEEDLRHEIEAGCNMVEAAKECGVKHFVFSTLPNMVDTTNGRFKSIHHMDNKHAIEKIAREKLEGYTGLIPGFFYTNLARPQYSQRQADGTVRFAFPLPHHQVAQWTDPTYDMGVFANSQSPSACPICPANDDPGVFELGVDKTKNKNFLVLSPRMTPNEMTSVFALETGQSAVHEPLTPDEFGELASKAVGPGFREDAKQMMAWAAIAPSDKVCFGSMDADADDSYEILGVRASTFKDFLQRTGWNGP